MGNPNNRGARLVRPGAPATSRIVLCVLAFLATAAGVMWLASHPPQTEARYSATAKVWHATSPSQGSGGTAPEEPSRPDAPTAQRRILSDENLEQALARVAGQPQGDEDATAGTSSPTVDEIRRAVRVTAVESAAEGPGIAVSYSAADPDRAVRLVNALTTGYAEAWTARQKAAGNREYLEAQAAAERAREKYLEVKARFDDFVRQHFLEQQALVDRAARGTPERRPEPAPKPAPEPPVAQASPRPAPVDPERVALERRLAQLQQERAELLTTRRPIHPEVRYTDILIGQVADRLASMPPAEPASTQPPQTPRAKQHPEPPPPVAEPSESTFDGFAFAELSEALRAAAEEFRVQKEAVDRAEEEYDRLAEAKRRLRDAQLAGPAVKFELAERSEAQRPGRAGQGSILGALVAALAVSIGVGLVSSGFDVDLPLATVAEAEAALAVPVVGTIPSTDAAPPDDAPGAAQRRGARLQIALGVLLIGACFASLVAVL